MSSNPARNSLLVIVVAYRSADHLPGCLRSIRLHAPDALVVVVDNSSDPQTASALSDFSDLQLTLVDPGENLGYAGGVSRGFQSATPSDFLLILNPDTELLVDPRTFAGMLDRFSIASGILLVDDPSPSRAPNARPRATLSREWLRALIGTRAYTGPRLGTDVAAVDQLDGAYLLMRYDWYDHHPLDTRYELYYEDVSLCDTARLVDGCGLAPWPAARHHGGASSGRARLLSYKVLRVSRARYLKQKYPRSPTWFLLGPFVLERAVRALARVPDPEGARGAALSLAWEELRQPGSVRVLRENSN